MMLTWKIFVTVMSMVSLTLQMESSNTSSSSGSSGLIDLGSPWVTDEENGRRYPHAYNYYNRFDPGNNAYYCYAYIRLYCGTENEDVTSEDCAKQGIFLYRKNEPTYREQYHISSPHMWVYEFFENFPLAAGQFKFPEEFCAGKDESCHEVLKNYRGEFKAPMKMREKYSDPGKDNRRRFDIAWYALHYRDLYELKEERKTKSLTSESEEEVTFESPEEDFEIKYLEYISEHISSKNPNHNPYNYCEHLKKVLVKYEIPYILNTHLQLNIRMR